MKNEYSHPVMKLQMKNNERGNIFELVLRAEIGIRFELEVEFLIVCDLFNHISAYPSCETVKSVQYVPICNKSPDARILIRQ